MTSDLASYLRDLVTVGAVTAEERAFVALLDASWLLEAGADPRTVLERLADEGLPYPYASRVAECLSEWLAAEAMPRPYELTELSAPPTTATVAAASVVPSFDEVM